MVNESRTLGFVLLLTVAGLVVMLYGVTLNAGQSLNTPMIVGGGIVGGGCTVLVAWIGALDEESAGQAEA